MPPERIAIRSGAMTAEIGPQGGVLLALAVQRGQRSIDLMRRTPAGQEDDPLAAACFPLLPFGSRVRGNRFDFGGKCHTLARNHDDRHYLHGDGWLARWQVVDRGSHTIILGMQQAAGRTPYCYTGAQHFALAEDSLKVTLSVRNTGDAALPFGLGLHPYFPLNEATTLRAAAARMWPEAEDHLPGPATSVPDTLDFSRARSLPRMWVNNGFGEWDGRAAITWPEQRMALDIAADAAFRTWVLFVPGPACEHFCFEPMTHAPDGHNQPDLGGLTVLAPGEELQAGVTFRCRDSAPAAA